jgi:hypothetical protein
MSTGATAAAATAAEGDERAVDWSAATWAARQPRIVLSKSVRRSIQGLGLTIKGIYILLVYNSGELKLHG